MTDLVLVFDTETTGLPNWSAPSDHPDQPHIVSIAAELCTTDGEVVETYSQIVKVGVPIPPETTAIHGITDQIANERGIAPARMLADFFSLVDRASLILAYNAGFDLRLVRIAAARHLGQKWDCPKPKDDPMWIVCKELGIKKPKLTDAMQIVFGEKLEGAHNAMVDCTAARRIYFEMVRRGYVSSNPRAVAGSNMPPVETPPVAAVAVAEAEAPTGTPFEQTAQEVNDLYDEAKNWLDGDPITTEGQAAEIAKLREKLRDAAKRGEERRVAEAKPFDEAKKKVQDAYNPLIHKDKGMVKRAVDACNAALAPWLKKIDDEQRAQAEVLRKQAVDKAAAALKAAQEAATTNDLGARERAEDLLASAKNIVGTMRQAEKARPQVHGETRRAVGMKSVYTPVLIDPTAAIEYYREAQPAALKEWMIEQALKDVREGKTSPNSIPGFRVDEARVPS